jgi:hypothetical protein
MTRKEMEKLLKRYQDLEQKAMVVLRTINAELDNRGFSADDDWTFDKVYSQATNPSDGYYYEELLDYVFKSGEEDE